MLLALYREVAVIVGDDAQHHHLRAILRQLPDLPIVLGGAINDILGCCRIVPEHHDHTASRAVDDADPGLSGNRGGIDSAQRNLFGDRLHMGECHRLVLGGGAIRPEGGLELGVRVVPGPVVVLLRPVAHRGAHSLVVQLGDRELPALRIGHLCPVDPGCVSLAAGDRGPLEPVDLIDRVPQRSLGLDARPHRIGGSPLSLYQLLRALIFLACACEIDASPFLGVDTGGRRDDPPIPIRKQVGRGQYA